MFGREHIFVCVAAAGFDEQNRIAQPKFPELVKKYDKNGDKAIQANELPGDHQQLADRTRRRRPKASRFDPHTDQPTPPMVLLRARTPVPQDWTEAMPH